MRKLLVKYIHASMFFGFLAMILATCGGGGGGGDGSSPATTSPPAPSEKSVVITGTVPGTVAIAYDLVTGEEAARDVASGTPKTFTLNVAPGAYYLMFIESEGTPAQRNYAFQNVTGGNVLTCQADSTLDLGVLVFNDYPGTAVPRIDPVSGNANVAETFMPAASFSPGDGKWTATKRTVSSSCAGRSPGTTVTENVTIAQGFGLVTYTPAGTTDTAGGVPNVNTVILTGYLQAAPYSSLVTMELTMQPDGSIAGNYSELGYGGGCSEEGTITAVRGTSPPATATLTGLSINGPSSMSEYGTATYAAAANWSDGSASTVTPTWTVFPQVAEISADGVLSCQGGVASDQAVTIRATYSSGGITATDSVDVTIIAAPSIPFTDQELSGKVFFQSRGYTSSLLYKLNADSSLEMYLNVPGSLGDRGYYITGTWSNDTDSLFLNFRFADMGPYTVQRIADSSTEMDLVIYEEFWGSHVATWEKGIPVEPSLLPGAYTGNDGSTWVFNADGTGTVTIQGGTIFAWSVDSDGVLRVSSSTGYSAVLHARATSQSTATEYTILKVGFVELTSTGAFFKYYGGMDLTRQ